ncbi:MAG: hypothetical protein B6D56_05035 [Candidatus Omnitrophica bacterium 4484_70.1]|nr:MAG: hypothetical protein B6D56_05035 [Candidatus Omnitrophica bacterium 4484_70.1]
MEDKKLIEGFLRGDKLCFDKLVLKYNTMVFNVCFRMLNDLGEALNISQDVFLKVYQSLENFKYETKFSTYLYRMSINFSRNRLKASGKLHQKIASSLKNRKINAQQGNSPKEVTATTSTIQNTVNEKEKSLLILEALNSLPLDYKEIMILRELEGLKYEEIADILRIDLGTVKSKLSRARKFLRKKLKGLL